MEAGTGGVGGLVIASHLERPLATGGEVPRGICRDLLYGDKIQRNTQTEVLGVYLTLKQFARHLRGCDIVVFIDNDAALASLLAGSSGEADSNDIVTRTWSLAREYGLGLWFEPVRSKSNPSDCLSRSHTREGASECDRLSKVFRWRFLPIEWPASIRPPGPVYAIAIPPMHPAVSSLLLPALLPLGAPSPAPQSTFKWGVADVAGTWVDCSPTFVEGLRAVNTNLRQHFKDFTWAALHVHVNYQSRVHTDSNAQGTSAMCTMGPFSGGRLWVQHAVAQLLTDTVSNCPSPVNLALSGALLDCRLKWRRFPSGTAHATEPFQGNRITILAYTPAPWGPDPSIIARLMSEGFRPPGQA